MTVRSGVFQGHWVRSVSDYYNYYYYYYYYYYGSIPSTRMNTTNPSPPSPLLHLSPPFYSCPAPP